MATETKTGPGEVKAALPNDAQERKNIPLVRGCLDYFPAALAAVAELSRIANEKHNPGEPMHHARGKSMDHADCIVRHLVDRGTTYEEVINGKPVTLRHSTSLAWRALALLQEELEAAGAPLARGARLPSTTAAPALPVPHAIGPGFDANGSPVECCIRGAVHIGPCNPETIQNESSSPPPRDAALEDACAWWPRPLFSQCSSREPEQKDGLRFYCNRPRGHAGEHVGVDGPDIKHATVRRWGP